MVISYNGWCFLILLWLIMYVKSYDVLLDIFVDDYLTALYHNNNLLDGKATTIINERIKYIIDGNYGDTFALEIQNSKGPMGIAGNIVINNNFFSTTTHDTLWTTNYVYPFDDALKTRFTKTTKQNFLGWYAIGTYTFSFTIPVFFTISGETKKILSQDVYSFDVNSHYTAKYNEAQDKINFQIYKFPDHGTLKLSNGLEIVPDEKYSPDVFNYFPEEGGFKEVIEFVMTNSTKILSDRGIITLYVCWKGCSDCEQSNICKNADCTIFGDMNCISCITGYGEFITKDGRKECWDSSIIYDYYYLDPNNRYQDCFNKCQRCSTLGDQSNNQCDKCKEGFYFVYQTKNCEDISYKDNGYYLDSDKQFHPCSSNCTLCDQPQENKVHHCTGCAAGFTLLYGNCYIRSPPNSDGVIIDKIDLSPGDILKQNVTDLADENVIIKGDNFSMQIYHTTKDDEKAQENGKNYMLSTVTLSECINIIRKKLNLKDDEEITIVKIDRNVSDSTVNQVDFLLYDPSGNIIDYSICENTNITVKKPFVNPDLVNMTQVKDLYDQGIDTFDPNDSFFNDICVPYDSDNGTDVVLNDRRKNYYNNISLCEDNCEYQGFDPVEQVATCSCQPVSPEEKKKEIEEETVNLSNLKNAFLNSLFSTNIVVVKCFKTAFSKKILFNLGFWIVGFLVFWETILFIIFLYNRLEKLREYLYVFLENPPKKTTTSGETEDVFAWIDKSSDGNPQSNFQEKKSQENTSKKQEIFFNKRLGMNSKDFEVSSKNCLKNQRIFSNSRRNSKKSGISKSSLSTRLDSVKNTFLITENKNEKCSFSPLRLKNKITLKRSLDGSNSDVLYTSFSPKRTRNIPTYTSTIQEIDELYDPKKHINLIPLNYDDLSYEEAIQKDERTFCQMYWFLLKEKQICISAFLSDCFMDLRVIKIYILCFSISLDFTLNAFFYTDSEISDLYYSNGVLDFISSLPQSFYSCAIGFVIGFAISHLSDSKQKLEKILVTEENKTKKEVREKGLKEIRCLRIKLIFFFGLSFLLSTIFWYYVTCFCAVYHNTQKAWCQNSLTSIVISQVLPFGTSFILAGLRYLSVSKKKRCGYKFYKFIDFFI